MHSGFVFNKIPTILKSEEILDKSLSRAVKIEVPYQKELKDKVRGEVISKVALVEKISTGHLSRIIKKFPTIERVHPFYYALVDLMFDVDQYKMSLSRIQWAKEKIVDISTMTIRSVKRAQYAPAMNKSLKAFYGRFSSIIDGISKDLDFLAKCRDYMRKIPEIDPVLPTFIIAGMPNVGKSSLLSVLTNAQPKIAEYPFTTQSIYIGHAKLGNNVVQIIDTPGILDRSMNDRNEMEMKAILALKHIDGVILFLLDRSEITSYSAQDQEKLYNEIKSLLDKPIIRIQSKADISKSATETVVVSVNDQKSIDNLKTLMIKQIEGRFR